MTQETFSVRSHHGSKSTVERAAEAIFTACGFFAVLAVASITLYMIFGTPALFKVGIWISFLVPYGSRLLLHQALVSCMLSLHPLWEPFWRS